MRTTAMARTPAIPQLEMLTILCCFDLPKGKKGKKITKLALAKPTNCRRVSSMMANYETEII